MTIRLTPAFGPAVPVSEEEPVLDLMERMGAARKTIEFLVSEGLELPPHTRKDEHEAAAIVAAYATDPEQASRTVTTKRMARMTTTALAAVDTMLQDFGVQVVQNSAQLRHYVTNKLLEESENPDPRIRIRALELLGKISDVGLFSEKTEVTVTHQTSSELRDLLKTRLAKLVNPDAPQEIIDAEVVQAPQAPQGPQQPEYTPTKVQMNGTMVDPGDAVLNFDRMLSGWDEDDLSDA